MIFTYIDLQGFIWYHFGFHFFFTYVQIFENKTRKDFFIVIKSPNQQLQSIFENH